ncbi:15996_t:CDS:2, partial [Cetraspora pellucida]
EYDKYFSLCNGRNKNFVWLMKNARHLAINGESQWWLNYDDVEIGKPKINIKYCPSYFSCINPSVSGRMSFGKPAKKKEKTVTPEVMKTVTPEVIKTVTPEVITLDDDDVMKKY